MPYVQFLYDPTIKALVKGSVATEPTPLESPDATRWKVVLDARNRVVVRAGHLVIGTATWNGERTTSHAEHKLDAIEGAHWGVIDSKLWPLQSGQAPANPAWVDVGELVRLDAAKQAGSKVLLVIALLVVAALGVGAFFLFRKVEPYLPRGNAANGDACTANRDCTSGVCMEKRCTAKKLKGDRCTRDSQCSSGACSIRPNAPRSCD